VDDTNTASDREQTTDCLLHVYPKLIKQKKYHRPTGYKTTFWFLVNTWMETLQTRRLYCVECPQYSSRLEALGYLCDYV